MKVALVLAGFPEPSETFIVNKVVGLAQSGVRVDVICRRLNRQAWRRFPQLLKPPRRLKVRVCWPVRPHGIALLLVLPALLRVLALNPLGTWRYLTRGWRYFGVETPRRLYLDAELLAARPDVVHFEFGTLAAERMYLRELLACPVVVSLRGFDLNFAELERPGYYKAVWAAADAIHCLGHDLWVRACSRGCPPTKLKVLIPPAIDISFFQPVERTQPARLGAADRPLRVLSVGRLEWKKGYEFALEAIALLRYWGIAVEFHIVGGGDHLEAVAFCRRQFGLEDCVSLLGALPAEGVLREMHWADVFLHAAVSEGFCNAVIEAQATGLPVVTSDADGLAENVEDGVTGFVTPRRDPRAMAERLAWLAEDGRLRAAMAENGPARVRQRFRLDSQIAAFVRLYRQTCFIAFSRVFAN